MACGLFGCLFQRAGMLDDPVGLAGVGGKKGQTHEPPFAGLAELAFGFENLGGVGETVEFFGVDQCVAVLAD